MSAHSEPSPLAGTTIRVRLMNYSSKEKEEVDYRVEDYWDRVGGKSWMDMKGNPACMNYGIRSGLEGLPFDDEVLYGKVGSFGHLIHVSEVLPSLRTKETSDE